MSEPMRRHLYDLMPAVHRERDAATGHTLLAIFEALERQFNTLETNIGDLYDDWFIETCADWVIPYLGDLVGVREPDPDVRPDAKLRRMVANAIAYRKRKGLAAVVGQVARDATGWRVLASERYRELLVTQSLEHITLDRGRSVDLRDNAALDALDTPFGVTARTASFRAVRTERAGDDFGVALGPPTYSISSLGLSAWRLESFPVIRSTARAFGPRRFAFHALATESHPPIPLFNDPLPAGSLSTALGPMDVPGPIRRRDLERHPDDLHHRDVIAVVLDDGTPGGRKLKANEIVAADLTDWEFPMLDAATMGANAGGSVPSIASLLAPSGWRPDPSAPAPAGFVRLRNDVGLAVFAGMDGRVAQAFDATVVAAVDPVLGRLVLAPFVASVPVEVNYSYGFSDSIGGGPSVKPPASRPHHHDGVRILVQSGPALPEAIQDDVCTSLSDAFDRWVASGVDGEIEIVDSRTYGVNGTHGGTRHLAIAGRSLVVRGRDGQIPCIDGSLVADGGTNQGTFRIEGIWMRGSVGLTGAVRFELADATLLPGEAAPSISSVVSLVGQASPEVSAALSVRIERSIVGPVRIASDGAEMSIHESIVDGVGGVAIGGYDPEARVASIVGVGTSTAGRGAPRSTIDSVTVFGSSELAELDSAKDSIFTGPVVVQRLHKGTLRYCFVADGSRTPQRFRCEPDLALARSPESLAPIVRDRMTPMFTSRRFGHPGYGQLSADCAHALLTAGSEGGAPGAFEKRHPTSWTGAMRMALAEFLPAGLDASITFVT